MKSQVSQQGERRTGEILQQVEIDETSPKPDSSVSKSVTISGESKKAEHLDDIPNIEGTNDGDTEKPTPIVESIATTKPERTKKQPGW